MDLKNDFAFVPQPPLAPFSKVPADAPLPSADIWSPQPHPAPVDQTPPTPTPTPTSAPEGTTVATTTAEAAGIGTTTPVGPAAGPAEAPPLAAGSPTPVPAASVTTTPVTQAPVMPQPGAQTSTPPAASPPPSLDTTAVAQDATAPATVTVKEDDAVKSATSLGPLAGLIGKWSGGGFNVIWRPSNRTGPDHFLEINRTQEDIEFIEIPGDIPNRGLLQGDISMRGLRYLQQTQDANSGQGIHIEPGLWAFVPATVNPAEPETVVRMASIPHGTSVMAQGVAIPITGTPPIEAVSIAPFSMAFPNQPMSFPETNLAQASTSRTSPDRLGGITQAMLDDPNSLLRDGLEGVSVTSATRLNVSSAPVPVLGGGVSNTAFLNGGSSGPNAQAVLVTASFWIEEIAGPSGEAATFQLQYSQTVMLNFAGLSWPHVSVATLKKIG